jgi:predicted GNAT family acetyltransferase
MIEGDPGQVLGVAMHTRPHNVFLSRMPQDAARLIAQELATGDRFLPGVNGAIESTTVFATAWEDCTGQSSELVRATKMYRLAELVWPEPVPGQARRAEIFSHLAVVTKWLAAFHDEVHSDAPAEDWDAVARRRMDAGTFHVWQAEGEVVALAGVTEAPLGVARIGPVYTPLKWRRKGYASNITAMATAAALGARAE